MDKLHQIAKPGSKPSFQQYRASVDGDSWEFNDFEDFLGVLPQATDASLSYHVPLSRGILGVPL
jgi:hypothetical protein